MTQFLVLFTVKALIFVNFFLLTKYYCSNSGACLWRVPTFLKELITASATRIISIEHLTHGTRVTDALF